MIILNQQEPIQVLGTDTTTGKRIIKAPLLADTKNEVLTNGTNCSNIVGLSENDKLGLGTTVFTATLELGVLSSTGEWTF